MDINIIKLAECIAISKDKYPNKIKTERLLLKKSNDTDGTNVLYSVCLKTNEEKIGEVVLVYDGEIWYRIDEKYRNNGYATEAVQEIVKKSYKEHYLSIDQTNLASRKVAKKLGFKKVKKMGKSNIYYKNT